MDKGTEKRQPELFNVSVDNIDILFQQYRMFFDGIESHRNRRLTSYSLYLVVLSALIASGEIFQTATNSNPLLNFFGFVIAVLWFTTVRYYFKLHGTQYGVLKEIERKLPLYLVTYEWEVRMKMGFKPFNWTEYVLPSVFTIAFLIQFFWSLTQLAAVQSGIS